MATINALFYVRNAPKKYSLGSKTKIFWTQKYSINGPTPLFKNDKNYSKITIENIRGTTWGDVCSTLVQPESLNNNKKSFYIKPESLGALVWGIHLEFGGLTVSRMDRWNAAVAWATTQIHWQDPRGADKEILASFFVQQRGGWFKSQLWPSHKGRDAVYVELQQLEPMISPHRVWVTPVLVERRENLLVGHLWKWIHGVHIVSGWCHNWNTSARTIAEVGQLYLNQFSAG